MIAPCGHANLASLRHRERACFAFHGAKLRLVSPQQRSQQQARGEKRDRSHLMKEDTPNSAREVWHAEQDKSGLRLSGDLAAG